MSSPGFTSENASADSRSFAVSVFQSLNWTPCPFLLTAPELRWCVARGFWQHVGGQSGYPWYTAVCLRWKHTGQRIQIHSHTNGTFWQFLRVHCTSINSQAGLFLKCRVCHTGVRWRSWVLEWWDWGDSYSVVIVLVYGRTILNSGSFCPAGRRQENWFCKRNKVWLVHLCKEADSLHILKEAHFIYWYGSRWCGLLASLRNIIQHSSRLAPFQPSNPHRWLLEGTFTSEIREVKDGQGRDGWH